MFAESRRHNDSVVVLDRDSQQLVLRNAAAAAQSDSNLELTECPYCLRPMHQNGPARETGHANSGTQPEFVNPDYFRLLHNSLPSSAQSPYPPSPHRRLVQPALPGGGPTNESGYSGDSGATHGISSAAFSQNYFKKFFVEESQLGKGGKGVVLLVKHVLDGVSLGYYACKRVPVGDDHKWLEKVLGEVQLLQHLSHHNLVSYRHVWLENAKISTFGPSVPCAFILQQYCNAGDLHNYVFGSMQTSVTKQQLKERLRRKSRGEPELESELGAPRTLQLEEIYSFFKDITSGIRYLHVNGYIHRDLKPSNCLLHQTGDGLRVLVSDFGEVQSQDAMRKSTGSTGTVSYCAPEVVRRDYPGGPLGNFTFKADIFSLGMILYFLCFAQLPYRHANIVNEETEDLDRLREEVSQWSGLPDLSRTRSDLPEKLYTFLEHLLSEDPNKRPSADEVLNGIQAGVNGKERFRFKKPTPVGPETRSSSQVHLYDSPPSSPISRASISPHARYFRRGSVYDSDDANGGSESTNDNHTEKDHTASPERNLVARRGIAETPPFPPVHREDSEERRHDNVGPREVVDTRPLLPPLPPPSRFSRTFNYAWYYFSPFTQLLLFLLQVVSVSQPCSPVATNPWVFYPLLLLAAVNIWMPNFKVQVIFIAIHSIAVGICIRLGVLCVWDHPRAAVYDL